MALSDANWTLLGGKVNTLRRKKSMRLSCSTLLLLLLAACGAKDQSPPLVVSNLPVAPASSTSAQPQTAELAAAPVGIPSSDADSPRVVAAKTALQEELIDPESTRYRRVAEFQHGTVCGDYNAKNGMGGYVGYRAFIYNPDVPWGVETKPSQKDVDVWCSDAHPGKQLAELSRWLDTERRACNLN